MVERLVHWAFVNEGEGVDPSYPTTLIPLVAVPLISLLWPGNGDDTARREDFYSAVRLPAASLGVVAAHRLDLGARPPHVNPDPAKAVVSAGVVGLVGEQVL